jgi:UDP-GlcNAc:undecaprenyl-phosphate/decaprenyl-phosphate GlcNAc-1-phosphate transferase
MTENRWLFGCSLAALVCFAVLIGLRSTAFRVGLVDKPGGRKRHGDTVPLLGGVALILATFAACAVSRDEVWAQGTLRALFVAITLLMVAGLLDDLHELSPMAKLVFQFSAVAVLASSAEVKISTLGSVLSSTPILTVGWAIPFTLIAAIGLMNAVNMTDGLDGLVAGASLITLGCMGWLAKSTQAAYDLFNIISFVCVSLSIFLVFNFPYPGRVFRTFLGDSGSLFLGLMICFFAIMLSQPPLSIAPPIVFVWLCGLFLLDFLCITIQRILRRKNPLSADRRHWHHLLVRSGFSSLHACLILLVTHGAVCAVGIIMWKAGISQRTMLAVAIFLLICALCANLFAARWVPKLARTVRERNKGIQSNEK